MSAAFIQSLTLEGIEATALARSSLALSGISNLAASVNESKKSSGIASQSSNNKINSTQQAKTGLGAITGRFATIMKGTGVWIAVTFTIAAIILGIFIFTSYKNKKNGINKR